MLQFLHVSTPVQPMAHTREESTSGGRPQHLTNSTAHKTGDSKAFGRYLLVLGSVWLGILLIIGLFNLMVDPYGVFGMNRTGIYINADREAKAGAISRFDYDAVLMGTSKAAMIDTTQLEGYTFFSATFGGATIEELYAFADRHVHDAKLAVLALDLGMFGENPPLRENAFSPLRPGDYLTYLFSTSVLEASFRTLRRHLQGQPPSFRSDGSYITDRWAADKDTPNPVVLEREFTNETLSYERFRLSPERLQILHELQSLLESRNARVLIVINPLHERSVRILRESPAWPRFLEWKAYLQSLSPHVTDLSDSVYSESANFFLTDPVHFRSEIGVEWMNREVLSLP